MEGARFKEETNFGTFPTMIAFVRFTLWSLMNSLFFLIMGQMFPTEHSEKYPGQFNLFEVSKIVRDVPQEPTNPESSAQTFKDAKTEQYFEQPGQQEYSFNENEHQDVNEEPAEIIDGNDILEKSSPATKPQKRRRQRRPKREGTETHRIDQGDVEGTQDDLDAPSKPNRAEKKNPNKQKSRKERDSKPGNDNSVGLPLKSPKPKESKSVRKAESWPLSNNNNNRNRAGSRSSRKLDKEEMDDVQPSTERKGSYSHSMLRKLTPPKSASVPALEEVTVRPIRQPFAPVSGQIGFSKEYRNSRRAALC